MTSSRFMDGPPPDRVTVDREEAEGCTRSNPLISLVPVVGDDLPALTGNSILSLPHRLLDIGQPVFQFGDFYNDNIPEGLILQSEIKMSKHVPQARNLAPLHFGKLCFRLVGDSLCRLSEDFKVSENGIINDGVFRKACRSIPFVYCAIFAQHSGISSR